MVNELFKQCEKLSKKPIRIRVIMATKLLKSLNVPIEKIDTIKQNLIQEQEWGKN